VRGILPIDAVGVGAGLHAVRQVILHDELLHVLEGTQRILQVIQLGADGLRIMGEEGLGQAAPLVHLHVLVLVRGEVIAQGVHAEELLPRGHRQVKLLHQLLGEVALLLQLLAVPAAPYSLAELLQVALQVGKAQVREYPQGDGIKLFAPHALQLSYAGYAAANHTLVEGDEGA
jgi:hypothetical protein